MHQCAQAPAFATTAVAGVFGGLPGVLLRADCPTTPLHARTRPQCSRHLTLGGFGRRHGRRFGAFRGAIRGLLTEVVATRVQAREARPSLGRCPSLPVAPPRTPFEPRLVLSLHLPSPPPHSVLHLALSSICHAPTPRPPRRAAVHVRLVLPRPCRLFRPITPRRVAPSFSIVSLARVCHPVRNAVLCAVVQAISHPPPFSRVQGTVGKAYKIVADWDPPLAALPPRLRLPWTAAAQPRAPSCNLDHVRLPSPPSFLCGRRCSHVRFFPRIPLPLVAWRHFQGTLRLVRHGAICHLLLVSCCCLCFVYKFLFFVFIPHRLSVCMW